MINLVWFLFNVFHTEIMKKINYLILITASILMLDSCKKIEQIPPIPKIEYISFQIFDTTDILGNKAKGGRLKFSFQDGDGDLGMHEQQGGQALDSNDLNITLFRKIKGEMSAIPDTVLDPLKVSSFRIPYMERTGQNKILRGKIDVIFLYQFYTIADTIKYDFYIKDRALNKSNVVSTNQIIVAQNRTY